MSAASNIQARRLSLNTPFKHASIHISYVQAYSSSILFSADLINKRVGLS